MAQKARVMEGGTSVELVVLWFNRLSSQAPPPLLVSNR